MLTVPEVKPLLVHEDRFVREAALYYLKGSWSDDPDIAPLILQSYRQYATEDALLGVAYCSQFRLTPQTLDDVLDCLGKARDLNVAYHLNRAIANAPVDVLSEKEAAILETANMSQGTLDRVKQRLEFSQWSSERLWAELYDYARRSEDKLYVNDIDHGYADNLINALAPFDIPDAAVLGEMLAAEKSEFRWLPIFLIKLVGERRVRAMIPTLVDRYRIDADYMLECVTDSLAKIGDPEAVRLVRAAFPNEAWGYRNYSSGLLGAIKHQESEDALLALLESETDPGLRTMLCCSLCELFSETGIDVIRRVIARGYDRGIDTLEERLLPVAQVLGVDLPDADHWRAERNARKRRQAERRAELDELGRRYQAAKAAGLDPFAKQPSPSETKTRPLPSEPQTIHRQGRRVGRNEPCPCGSGKKYKKCCGRSGN